MLKVNLDSGQVLESKAENSEMDLNKVILKWYKELEQYNFIPSSNYSVEGLKQLYEDTNKIRVMLSRVDSLISAALRLKVRLESNNNLNMALYEDSLDKLKINPQALINKGYSYHEREAFYRSSPSLINTRVTLRTLSSQLAELNTFLNITSNRYKYLDSCSRDIITQLNFLKLSHSILEN